MDNDIKKAEEKLEYLSSDPVTQELYFERERALHEKANLINTGIRQGIQQEKIDTVMSSYQLGLTIQQIAQIARLDQEQVKTIINQHIQ